MVCLWGNSNQIKIDNVSLSLTQMHEEVTFSLEEDLSTMNRFYVFVVFADYFNHKYWLNATLTESIEMIIDKEKPVNLWQVNNTEKGVWLLVEIEQTMDEYSNFSFNIADDSLSIE